MRKQKTHFRTSVLRLAVNDQVLLIESLSKPFEPNQSNKM